MPKKIKRTRRKNIHNHRSMRRRKMKRKTRKRKTNRRKTTKNNSLIIDNRYKVIKRLNKRKYSGGTGFFTRIFDRCLNFNCGVPDGYTKVKELGKGSRGIVYLVQDTNDNEEFRALKLGRNWEIYNEYNNIKSLMDFKKNNSEEYSDINIIDAHKRSRLDNPIDGYDAYLVIDYIPGVNLHDYKTRQINESEIQRYFYQITKVVDMMHSMDPPLYHCDIKPENIMIYSENAYLIDFGLCTRNKIDTMRRGTPKFTPPYSKINEYKSSRGQQIDPSGIYDHDTYSIMASIIDMLFGIEEFIEFNVEKIEEKYIHDNLYNMILGIMYNMPYCAYSCYERTIMVRGIKLIQNIKELLSSKWIQGGNRQ